MATALIISAGCRVLEDAGAVAGLAADGEPVAPGCEPAAHGSSEAPPLAAAPAPTPDSAPAAAPGSGGRELNNLSLIGPVYPGLAGQLHSSLCDPASDPYGTCI